MPRKHRQVENQRIKFSSIVQRLPLYRFLDESRAELLRLQPAWRTWFTQLQPNLPESAAYLSAIDAQVLTVCVENASIAALIKHQQHSLLTALNKSYNTTSDKNGSSNSTAKHVIRKIKVHINLSAGLTPSIGLSTSALQDTQKQYRANNIPDAMAINSVKQLQSSVKNKELANTLGDLAETLEKLSK